MAIFDEDTPPWVRALVWVVGALLVGVVALAVTLVVVLKDDEEGPTPAKPTETTGSQEPTSAPVGGCPDLPSSSKIPSELSVEEWTPLYNGLEGPYASDVGPAQNHAGVHSCFAHSPEGAALSTIWFALQAAGSVNEERGEQMLKRLSSAARSAGQDDGLEWTSTPPSPETELIGYRFLDVQDDRVVGEILVHYIEEDTFAAVTQYQVWEDGDWRVALNPDGDTGEARAVTDSSAFMMLEP